MPHSDRLPGRALAFLLAILLVLSPGFPPGDGRLAEGVVAAASPDSGASAFQDTVALALRPMGQALRPVDRAQPDNAGSAAPANPPVESRRLRPKPIGSGQAPFLVLFREGETRETLGDLLDPLPHAWLGPSDSRTALVFPEDPDAFRTRGGDRIQSLQAEGQAIPAAVTVNDPDRSQQWALDALAMGTAWTYTRGSDGVVVAIIDTGLDPAHEDFAGASLLSGYDFVAGTPVTRDMGTHGTFVAGIIAAVPNNATGIAGLCFDVSILPLQIFHKQEDGTLLAFEADLIAALYLAVEAGADVINLSLGSDEASDALAQAVDYALARGCIVVAAAGNAGNAAYNYPAALPGVVGVAAHNATGTRSSFSNCNDRVTVSAPGEGIRGLRPGSTYGNGSGTSFATPHVSAVAALARALVPDLSPGLFLEALAVTSEDGGDPGYDVCYGYGRLDPPALLAFVDDLRLPSDQCELLDMMGLEPDLVAFPFWTAVVPSETAVVSLSPQASPGATWAVSADPEGLVPLDASALSLLPGPNAFYLRILAENGVHARLWTILLYRASASGPDIPVLAARDPDGFPVPDGGTTRQEVLVLAMGGAAPLVLSFQLDGVPGTPPGSGPVYRLAAEGTHRVEASDGISPPAVLSFLLDRTPPAAPLSSRGSGRVDPGSISVALVPPGDAASTHYTLNGAPPGPDSPRYVGPLVLTGEYGDILDLRAVCFDRAGNPSPLLEIRLSFLFRPMSSADYRIDRETGRILGVRPGTTRTAFLSRLNGQGADVSLRDPPGASPGALAGTGLEVLVSYKDTILEQFLVLVRGDCSGDGQVNSLDLLQARRHLLGLAALDGAPAEAANANGDAAGINSLDLLLIRRHILGLAILDPLPD